MAEDNSAAARAGKAFARRVAEDKELRAALSEAVRKAKRIAEQVRKGTYRSPSSPDGCCGINHRAAAIGGFDAGN